MADEAEVLAMFRESGALLEGHFVLRSGRHSGHYFQCARVGERLDLISRLAAMLLSKLRGTEFSTVVAPAMGALVLGQEVARQAGSRYLFVEKVDGGLALRRNFTIHPGERILVVEDVITQGGRVREALDIVKEHGGNPVAAAVLVDRSEGAAQFEVPLVPLLRMSFPTYEPQDIPPELAKLPATKPGS